MKLLLIIILSASTIGLSAQTWSGTTPGNINYSLGKVGIGTSNPSSLLHLLQNNDTDPLATFILQGTSVGGSLPGSSNYIGRLLFTTRNNNVVGSIRGYYSNATGSPNYYPYGNLVFYTAKGDNAENEVMRINPYGNVGINSTDPISRLDIRGGDPSTITDILHIGGGSSWGGNGAAITLGGGALKSARIVGYTYDGSDLRGSLSLQTKMSDGSWYNGLVIASTSGFVGVGTAEPKARLHIENGNNTDAAILATASQNNSLVVSSTSPDSANGSVFKISHQFYEGNRNNGYISFHRGGDAASGFLEFGTSGLSRMFIVGNGNVGIGCDNPQNKLDVMGTIRATEIKVVSVEEFADFVFDKDYQLPKLTDVHDYIQEKGHLPNIPSAAEVKENGMSLVDMQVKLLQKIEELTLYAIDQNKKVEKQNEVIEALQKKIASLSEK